MLTASSDSRLRIWSDSEACLDNLCRGLGLGKVINCCRERERINF